MILISGCRGVFWGKRYTFENTNAQRCWLEMHKNVFEIVKEMCERHCTNAILFSINKSSVMDWQSPRMFPLYNFVHEK